MYTNTGYLSESINMIDLRDLNLKIVDFFFIKNELFCQVIVNSYAIKLKSL